MARRSEGWELRRDPRTGIWTVRFTVAGHRVHRSTGTRDRREAQRRAREIYELALRGHVARQRGGPPLLAMELEELLGGWLAAMARERRAATVELWTMYAETHWQRLFGDAAELVSPCALERYVEQRLLEVSASTVRKECSAIQKLLDWCARKSVGLLEQAPRVPRPPADATGTRAKVHQLVPLTDEQAEAILELLPLTVRAGRGGRGPRPCRPFFRVLWETGLRRGTLWRLEAPHDYRRGAAELVIRDEADKAAYGRTVPLTARAREALDAVCPDAGRIFPEVDYRAQLEKAALAIGIPAHLAPHLSHHDFRHGRTTHLLDSGAPLTGVMHLVGHRRATTTDGYTHAGPRAAAAALELVSGHRDGHRPEEPPKAKAPGGSPGAEIAGSAEERTRTSTGCPARSLVWRGNAAARKFRGVLSSGDATERHESPDSGHGVRLDRLVQASLEMVDAVLSGDPHLPSRALDVADLVAELAEAAGAVAPDVERDASEPG